MSSPAKKPYRDSVKARAEKPYTFVTRLRWFAVALLILAVTLSLGVHADKEPPILARVFAQKAQQIVEQLQGALSIDRQVGVVVVPYHPLVFSVEPMDSAKSQFRLSVELRFVRMLDDDELRAALAHELGHVWIYTHSPYLQTERLANEVGLRVVNRRALESVYTKLWKYEGTTGVPFDQLLGPELRVNANDGRL
jgi:hypothetical protein